MYNVQLLGTGVLHAVDRPSAASPRCEDPSVAVALSAILHALALYGSALPPLSLVSRLSCRRWPESRGVRLVS